MKEETSPTKTVPHLRFHLPSRHLERAFGSDTFGIRAEAFARFFGTPTFLISQTTLVGVWILANATGLVRFDLYPFILLNLAFSLQAAYAAPLILLAQTRQADRDKASTEGDALHREQLAEAGIQSQDEANRQLNLLLDLMKKNTELTELTHQLSQRIENLTASIHQRMQTP